MPLPLLALAVASFGIGTTEFVIMGLLPNVAADLGVSIPSAGMLVSGYALGVVVGAPILAILTSRMPNGFRPRTMRRPGKWTAVPIGYASRSTSYPSVLRAAASWLTAIGVPRSS